MDRAHCRHRMHKPTIPPFSCLQQCQISDAVKALKPLSCMEVTNTDSQAFTMRADPKKSGSHQCQDPEMGEAWKGKGGDVSPEARKKWHFSSVSL